jgi:hypothetical protein
MMLQVVVEQQLSFSSFIHGNPIEPCVSGAWKIHLVITKGIALSANVNITLSMSSAGW